MTQKTKTENKGRKLVTSLALSDLDGMLAKRQKKREKLVTNKEGKPFTRRSWVPNKATGTCYYQLVQYYYENGKRKLRVLEHYGVRPPRRRG